MSRKMLRATSLILCTLFLIILLAGCGSGSSKEAKEQPAGTETKSAAPLKIRMVNRINAEVKIDDNPITREIEKKANVKLDIEAPPIKDYDDKLNMIMASDDLPDLIYLRSANSSYENWAKQGLLIPLDDYISKYGNLSSNVTKDQYQSVKVADTGKIYMIPRPNKINYWGLMFNKVWLDKLGLKVPETPDELLAVAKAFTEKDPDGNGKPDTYGFSLPMGETSAIIGEFMLDGISTAFDVPGLSAGLATGIKDTDGNYKIREKLKGYIPYMTFLRKMYSEKAIEPEFFLNKMYGNFEKMKQGRVGISRGFENMVYGQLAKGAPDTYVNYIYTPGLKNEKGERINYNQPPMWGGWAVAKSCKNADGVLKFLDWAYSEEGVITANVGIKDLTYQDYDLKTRTVTRTAEMEQKALGIMSTFTTFCFAYKGEAMFPEAITTKEQNKKYNDELEAFKKVSKTVVTPAIKAPLLENFDRVNPDIVKKKNETEMKYVLGEISLDQFKAFFDNEYFKKIDAAEQEYIKIAKSIAP